MSYFDRLCWYAERFPAVLSRELRSMLEAAHLFQFPYVAHEVLPKTFEDLEFDFQSKFFVLPFRVVAIEDRSSCVLLWDDQSEQQGLDVKRWFIELAPLSSVAAKSWNTDTESVRDSLPEDVRRRVESAWNFSFGWFRVNGTEHVDGRLRYRLEGGVNAYHMLNQDGVMDEGRAFQTVGGDTLGESFLRNAMAAVEEMMVFNRPDRFIVRETPDKLRAKGGPKIPRTHERPVYTLLHVHDVRQKLDLPLPTGDRAGGVFVGERRRHVRRYPDDPARWPKMHGKAIVIPATWVGPSEARVGRRTFKIMLDL